MLVARHSTRPMLFDSHNYDVVIFDLPALSNGRKPLVDVHPKSLIHRMSR